MRAGRIYRNISLAKSSCRNETGNGYGNYFFHGGRCEFEKAKLGEIKSEFENGKSDSYRMGKPFSPFLGACLSGEDTRHGIEEKSYGNLLRLYELRVSWRVSPVRSYRIANEVYFRTSDDFASSANVG